MFKLNSEEKMKICFFGNLQSIHLQRTARSFVYKGHEVYIITREPSEIADVHVHVFVSHSISSFFYKIPIIARLFCSLHKYFEINRLKKFINKINPDLINAHFLTDYGISASKLNFHPLVITCWGSDILIAPAKFGEKHVKEMEKALTRADLVIVTSRYMKEKLIKMGIKKNIIVNPSGVDVSQFNPCGKKINTIKEKFGSKKIIISTRNLEPIYDVECLIKAFSYVIKQNNNVILLICGGGSLENNLKRLANNLGMDKYIHFLGNISYERMPDYLRSADIYVSTSLSDGTSISLLEAMACGVFPIVTDIPGNRPWVTYGKNGFLFEKGDYDKLSELILKSISREDMIKNAAKINQEIINEQGNWEKNSRAMEETYSEIIK
jgi:glycosyltransferase involved in cell wall biosynthesis